MNGWSSDWLENALGGRLLFCKETNRSFLDDGSFAILFPRLGSLFSRTFLHRAPFVLWISYWHALAARFQRKWDDFQDGRGKILVVALRVTQRSIVFGAACTASRSIWIRYRHWNKRETKKSEPELWGKHWILFRSTLSLESEIGILHVSRSKYWW